MRAAQAGVVPVSGMSCPAILTEVATERARQNAKWGEQNHPDGTGGPGARHLADWARDVCKAADPDTFWKILLEEVYEAGAESDQVALRMELVQVAAVCVQWIEAIDRRADSEGSGAACRDGGRRSPWTP
jgi:hypothetical protein